MGESQVNVLRRKTDPHSSNSVEQSYAAENSPMTDSFKRSIEIKCRAGFKPR
jgi:hypothetical protein